MYRRFWDYRCGLLAVILLCVSSAIVVPAHAQTNDANVVVDPTLFQAMEFRSVGPHRGGRVTAATGYVDRPYTFLMGTVGGGASDNSVEQGAEGFADKGG